ncbi:fructose-specific PTS transporter subunit EIIC [Streptomyces sp. NBC_00536]|uniref:PTS fructose transporter subunit IIABC n=1 Tax=Streptomyces sp. NBC_00536 TaxID=2975769 RepID=UPI002E80AFBE|nr:fructose-specific PTS transporter subunit EIIC [Streptomyces sp. NBC_00536]WUC79556.1 fructose-specific PTS transporter subunit EIIC [Streptomyces sp. NBC_00536]
MSKPMIIAELVDLDLTADSKEAAVRSLARRMLALGRVTDLEGFLADVAAREAQMPTGLEGGIGIPHCRSAHVSAPTLAFGRAPSGVDFGAPDGPADLIFLIAAPAGADDAHLTILSSLARRLMRPDFVAALRTTLTPPQAATLIADPQPDSARPAFEGPPEAVPGSARTRASIAGEAEGAPGARGVPGGAGVAGSEAGVAQPISARPAFEGPPEAQPGSARTRASIAGEAEGARTEAGVAQPISARPAFEGPPEAVPGCARTRASNAGEAENALPGAGDVPGEAEGGRSEAEGVPGGAGGAPSGAGAAQPTSARTGGGGFRVVAVTSCPTGIAHTYMAAESLQRTAAAEGIELAVETQGSAGFTRLDPAVIAAADAVVFAHDVPVRDRARFAGKPTVDVGVKAGINRPAELFAEAREKAARGETGGGETGGATPTPAPQEGESQGESHAAKLRTWLMSGVSYMVPFVAAGGLMIALAFAIGGYGINKAPSVAEHFVWTESASWAALLFQTGGLAFGFLVPVLAGYIAYGMADRPGLVPGFVGGAVALTVNAGFLGGLIAGLIAGGTVLTLQRVRVPAALRGIMPVVVLPLIGSAVTAFLMFLVVGKPVASLQQALTDWLSGLSGANAVILGVVLGLMMTFDLGGPLNKVAYAFAIGGLATPNEGSLKVMAAVMAAGMVPPLAMALATTVRGRLFSKTERDNGKAAWFLGASFISEGAIPFAAADPLRVIPASMVGGAVTGALSMAFECTLRAPHGGIFVIPLIGNPLLYLIAIAAGTGVTAGLVILLKGMRRQAPAPAETGTAAETEAKIPVAA